MHSRDWFFLGAFLATMHYLSRPAPAAPLAHVAGHDAAEPRTPKVPDAPARRVPMLTYDSAPHCPRYPLHYIRSRADGAVWCYECDRAYFSGFAKLVAA